MGERSTPDDTPPDFWANRCLFCGWTPADEDHECFGTAEPMGIGPGGHSWDDIGRAVGLEDDEARTRGDDGGV